MSPDNRPWDDEDPPAKPSSRNRLLPWLVFIAIVGAGLWLASRAFPGALSATEDKVWLGLGTAWVVLVSLRLFSNGPIRWGEKAKHLAIWLGIVVVIAIGFAYRGELSGVFHRVSAEAATGYPVATGPREMVIAADPDGGYFVMGKVNGEVVRFLIDTGASDTVLSPADARRIGIDVSALTFERSAETANGIGYGAAVVVDSLSVGSISVSDMPVVVNQAPMTTSLLGMSFLRGLESFHVRDGRLYLTARE